MKIANPDGEYGGDHVKGIQCPKCKKETVVYNGNYFCLYCIWAMPEQETPENNLIIQTYLNQRFEEAEDEGDQETMDRMKFYMELDS